MIAPAFLFFAEVSPMSESWQLGLISFLGIAALIVAIYKPFRRSPPLDSELVKFTAAITTLEAAVRTLSEAKEKHAGHAFQIAALERECKELRENAKIEASAQHKYMMETSREFFAQIKSETRVVADKIEALSHSMNKEFRDIASDIGALKEATENAKS